MESHQRSKVTSRHNGATLFFLLTFPFCLLELVQKDVAVSFEICLLTYLSGCGIHLLYGAMSPALVPWTPLKHCEPVPAVSDIYQPVPERPDHLHPQKLTVKAQQISRSTGSISHKSLEKAFFAYTFLIQLHRREHHPTLSPEDTSFACRQPCEPVLQEASEDQEALSEERATF